MVNWKKNFENSKELTISTCSLIGEPHSIIAISIGFADDKLLIADCHMQKTISNLKENPKISIISGYLRIRGKADIFNSGKYLDICIKDCEGIPDNPKNAILVDIEEVFDMDKCKLIFSK